MTNKIIGLTFFLSCTIFVVYSQNYIEGIVYDSSTYLPIPNVNIYLADEIRGTASNDEGAFFLEISKFPSTIVFSHVNYGRTEKLFYKSSNLNKIELAPLAIELNEIIVSASDPIQLISGVYENLSRLKDSISSKGFYRQWTKNDNVYSELIEKFYTSKINNQGIDVWRMDQGRYAVRKDIEEKKYLVNNNFSAFTENYLVFQKEIRSIVFPIVENAQDYFDFKIKSILKSKEKNGDDIYIISFSPKKGIAKPGFQGEVFVSSNYDLIKFKGAVNDPRFFPLPESQRKSISDLSLIYEVSSDNKKNNSILIESIKVDLLYKFKVDDKLTRNFHAHSFFFVHDIIKTEEKTILPTVSNSDFIDINNASYDESFWEKNNVLLQTPIEKDIIKQFKKTKSFGRIFQK